MSNDPVSDLLESAYRDLWKAVELMAAGGRGPVYHKAIEASALLNSARHQQRSITAAKDYTKARATRA